MLEQVPSISSNLLVVHDEATNSQPLKLITLEKRLRH